MQKDKNELLAVLHECLQKYDTDDIVSDFTLKIFEFMTYDVANNILKILESINSSFGLHLNDRLHYCINLFVNDGKIDIIKQLEEITNGKKHINLI